VAIAVVAVGVGVSAETPTFLVASTSSTARSERERSGLHRAAATGSWERAELHLEWLREQGEEEPDWSAAGEPPRLGS
jgi:hypothetical protein